MDVELVSAGREDEPVLQNLLAYYQYDFSEFTGDDVDAQGSFGDVSLGYVWDKPGGHAFLAKAEGMLAGLAIVVQRSFFTGNEDVTDMAEFFVMRKYRRQQVGREMATRLFDLFPGRWEVREMAANAAAQAFWRKVIGGYTNGRFEERVVDDERWRGPVQSFDTNVRG